MAVWLLDCANRVQRSSVHDVQQLWQKKGYGWMP